MKEWDVILNVGYHVCANKVIFSIYFFLWYLMMAPVAENIVCVYIYKHIICNITSALWLTDVQYIAQ